MRNDWQAIIFDLDGTLWDSVDAVTESWNEVLEEQPDVTKKLVPDDIRGIMGLVISEIGARFFPDLSESRRMEIMDECCDVECDYLSEYGANLYDGLAQTLMQLSQQYELFIVSNCQQGYIESFFEAHGLGKYFSDTENSGNTGLKKGDNIELIMERNGIDTAVYVGDTQGDCDAARQAGIPFIFAEYGFGSVNDYDYMIESIRDLPELLEDYD